MTERLWNEVNEIAVREGKAGALRISKAVGKHPLTVARWIRERRVPCPHDAYLLAKAVGLTDREATEIGKDLLSSSQAKESA